MIFIDTSAIYAMANTKDPNHQMALAAFQQALRSNERFLTHSYVLTEAIALLQNRLGLAPALAFEQQRLAMDVHWIGLGDHERAVAMLRDRGRRALSLTDCASFNVMRDYDLTEALAFDRHFAEEGFTQYSA